MSDQDRTETGKPKPIPAIRACGESQTGEVEDACVLTKGHDGYHVSRRMLGGEHTGTSGPDE